ncbi:hypothetical protein AB0O01_05505 [Streptomyces sp. NPDC093252]|uniref:hypothetical protein n=1 Tax=Streptomyces sp. NPDC093252 TaxID=3154980 RepID=UPI00342721A0
MAAAAHLLLSALSKHPDDASAPDPCDPADWYICVLSSEGARAQTPLTSEPPLPDAEPLTSEPPLAAPDADTTRP